MGMEVRGVGGTIKKTSSVATRHLLMEEESYRHVGEGADST